MSRSERRVVYRGCPQVVDAKYEQDSSQTITESLVDALAEAEGVDPIELPCLYEAADLETLTRLSERQDGTGTPDTVLTFTFGRWAVFVRADGDIRVCDSTRTAEPTPVFAD